MLREGGSGLGQIQMAAAVGLLRNSTGLCVPGGTGRTVRGMGESVLLCYFDQG